MKRNKNFQNGKETLYLIPTPIGNLKEFSSRALEVVDECDIVAAEDTRNASSLLAKFNIKKETFSLREHNETEGSEKLVSLIKKGKKVCYMSDAGCPGISDPGTILVKKCLENDINVSCVSGPSAFINALVLSSLPTNHFYFHGFLSAKDGEAKKELEELKNKKETIIFYESPHRINRTLSLLLEVLGDRQASIGREISKINEEFIYGSLKELSQIDESTLIGEMVIVVSGNQEEKEIDEEAIKNRLNQLIDKGLSTKTAIEIVSEEFNIGKNQVYKLTTK